MLRLHYETFLEGIEMRKLKPRIEKLEQIASPSTRITHIERHMVAPSADGPRLTWDVLCTNLAARTSEWMRGADNAGA